MAKRGAPLDDSGARFCVFSRKNKEKSLGKLRCFFGFFAIIDAQDDDS